MSSSPTEDPTKSSELESIANLVRSQSSLREGETYYLLHNTWWSDWKKWSGYERRIDSYSYRIYRNEDVPRPGPMDNSPLLDETEGPDVVRRGQSENYDYVILSKEIWDLFKSWYGGGPEIKRPCIKQRSYYQNLIVEVRKLKLRVIWSRKPKEIIDRWFSKCDTVGTFISEMAKFLKFDKSRVRVWDFHNARKLKNLENMDKGLEESQILDGQYMLIEEKKKDGSWPNDKIYKHLNQQSYYQPRSPTPAGCTGLSNLGNTCFMNSGLQCLSSTVPLIDYFLRDVYVGEINRDNPLGMKGEFASAYAQLLRELWSNNTSVVTPRDFKSVISKYAPQFTGYDQHDSHELIAFLLDGLHEDLNRIKKKPYVEQKDSNGRPDEEVALETWEGYKKRNDSIIVDLFQGQLKSRLRCPINGKVSNQFDPFMYLSVPIPVKNTRKIVFTFYPMNTQLKPKKFGISIEKLAGIWDLKQKMSPVLGSRPECLVILDQFSSKFHREWKDHDDVSDIRDNDVVVVYEVISTIEDLPKSIRKTMNNKDDFPEREYLRFPIFCREEESSSYSSYSGHSVTVSRPCIGTPFLINTHKDATYSQVYEQIKNYMISRGYLSIPDDKDDTKLFSIQMYQSYSYYSSSLRTLNKNDNGPIGASDRETLIIDLSPEARQYFHKEDPFVDVDESGSSKVDKSGKDVISLMDCLEIFTQEEQLGVNDTWYCPECKEFRQAYKKFDIWTPPQLLVVQLKRFSQVNRVWRDRLDNLIEFPLNNLDISKYVLGPQTVPSVYDLYAVSNHFGSMGGGHYTAFARHRNNNKWYKYDDSSVSEASEAEIVSRAAYILFYKRKDVAWPTFDSGLDRIQKSEEEEEEDEYEDLKDGDGDGDGDGDEEDQANPGNPSGGDGQLVQGALEPSSSAHYGSNTPMEIDR